MGIKISYENRQCVSAVCVWGGGNRRYRPFGGWNPAYHQDKTKQRWKSCHTQCSNHCGEDKEQEVQKRNILEYLTDEKHYPLGTAGKDFRAPEPDEEYIIQLCGDTVILNNGLLVEALSRLPVWKQEMVYLSYFRRIPQREIGRRYGRSRSAAGYHIRKAVRQLHEEMEGMTHEE